MRHNGFRGCLRRLFHRPTDRPTSIVAVGCRVRSNQQGDEGPCQTHMSPCSAADNEGLVEGVLNSTCATAHFPHSANRPNTDRAAVSFNFARPFCESCITADKLAGSEGQSLDRLIAMPTENTSFHWRCALCTSSAQLAYLLIHHSVRSGWHH